MQFERHFQQRRDREDDERPASATLVELPSCATSDFSPSTCTKIAAHVKGFTSGRTVMIACRWPVNEWWSKKVGGPRIRAASWQNPGPAGFSMFGTSGQYQGPHMPQFRLFIWAASS